MHEHQSRITQWLPWAGITLIIAAGAGGFYLYNTSNAAEDVAVHTVSRGTVQTVAQFSGEVTANRRVALSFAAQGRVADVTASVGDRVATGTVIAQLGTDELRAERTRAQAQLAAARSLLAELQAGTRPDAIAVQAAEVDQQESNRETAAQELRSHLNTSFTYAEDAIYRTADRFFDNPRGVPRFQLPPRGVDDMDERRKDVQTTLNRWRSARSASTTQSLNERAATVESYMRSIAAFLDTLARVINRTDVSVSDSQRRAVSSARDRIDEAIATLTRLQAQYASANTGVAVAKRQLALKEAGSREEAIAQQRAQVQAAAARVERIEAQIADRTITAPFAGKIAQSDIEPGEVARAHEPYFELIKTEPFTVEGDVSELDVAGIERGKSAELSFDAFPQAVLRGHVASIDPAETMVGKVPTYGVDIEVASTTLAVRPGMTVHVRITARSKDAVTRIPVSAIRERSGDRAQVLRITDGETEPTTIELGLTGDRGFVEVKSGLTAGQRIVDNP
jgi:RND family efflux transporter MFP subunit